MLAFVSSAVLAAAVAASPSPPPSAQLHDFAQRTVTQARTNFLAIRGERTESQVYRIDYALAAKAKAHCAQCTISDEFAWKGHAENWYLEQRWKTTLKSPALVANVKKQLAPIVSNGYLLHSSGTADYPDLTWRNPTKRTWIFIETFNGGFTVRIGHDLPKPIHTLATPTADDIAALRNAVTNFINLGIGPASNNFATLRGTPKKSIFGDTDYDLSVSFGNLLRDCHISDASKNSLNLDDYSPKWLMTCDTVPMVGDASTIEAQIKSAMSEALPSGYTVTTGKALGFDDYRWDNSDTQVAADIDEFASIALPKGLVAYGIGIIHFLPKPAST